MTKQASKRAPRTDKRCNVTLTACERRLLNDLATLPRYLGQGAAEDTIKSALTRGLVDLIAYGENDRMLVKSTAKGLRHQK